MPAPVSPLPLASRRGAAIRKEGSWTIAVVGDGAMTSGSSFEALNNIAHLNPEHLVIIFNDNGMSISENVGFLTNWRRRVISHPEYRAMIDRARQFSKTAAHRRGALPHRPEVQRRPRRVHAAHDVLDRDGFSTTWAPVDGHDFRQLEQTLQQVKNSKGSVSLVHVITHKGRGYEPAEVDPVKFHQPSSPLGSGTGRAHLLEGVRPDPDPDHGRRPVGRRHQRGHAGRHRPSSRCRRSTPTASSTSALPSSTP